MWCSVSIELHQLSPEHLSLQPYSHRSLVGSCSFFTAVISSLYCCPKAFLLYWLWANNLTHLRENRLVARKSLNFQPPDFAHLCDYPSLSPSFSFQWKMDPSTLKLIPPPTISLSTSCRTLSHQLSFLLLYDTLPILIPLLGNETCLNFSHDPKITTLPFRIARYWSVLSCLHRQTSHKLNSLFGFLISYSLFIVV